MNPLTENITKGAFGELLVQLRLLQYGVQAAPPIKDSGNDLIAIRGEAFQAIQVKARTKFPARVNDLPDLYHILAVVVLDPKGSSTELSLDACKVFLFNRDEVENGLMTEEERYLIDQERVEQLFHQ